MSQEESKVWLFISIRMFTVFLIKVVWEFGVETFAYLLALIKCCWVTKMLEKLFYKIMLFVSRRVKSVAIYINPNVYSFFLIKVVWEFGVETLAFALALIKCCWVAKMLEKLFSKILLFVSRRVYYNYF